MKNILLLTAVALLVTGCASYDLTGKTPREYVSDKTEASVNDFMTKPAGSSVTEIDKPYLDFSQVPKKAPKGDLTLRAASTPFGPLLTEIARDAGYSVVFSEAVDPNRRVSIEFNQADRVRGMRMLSFLAGYLAVFDHYNRTIAITDVATYTYKLPTTLFQQLSASYTVGGNPVNNSSGGGSGGSSGGGSSGGGSSGGSSGGGGGSSMQASFIISGTTSTNSPGVKQLITDMAGKNSEVVVSDLGVVSVRANAQAQKRVHDFLKNFAEDAMGQVEIEASIVEVTLKDDFELGIDWSRVIDPTTILGSTGKLETNMVSGIAQNPSMSATFTTSSISAVVNAIRKVTDAKVVSNPRIVAMNNSPANFFDGTQLPYLGSITATPSSSGLSTTTQLSGTAQFAVEGVSFSVQPSIIDARRVQITLVPVLSNVLGFETLDLGGGAKLTAPRQTNKQTFMKVMAESGQTLILGGLRYTVDLKVDTPTPLSPVGIQRGKQSRELVILMRANIMPAEDYDPLVGESV